MLEHLPLVRRLARLIHQGLPKHVPVEDLYGAGVLGLLDAFGKFDPSVQVKFSPFARFRIRGAILDSLRTLDWSPRSLRRKGRAVEHSIQALTAQCGRSPTDIEIACQLHIGLAAYQQLRGTLAGLEIGSLHCRRAGDIEEQELNNLASRPQDDPLFCWLSTETRQRVAKAIDELPDRERLVITLYYYEELTMNEIGIVLDLTMSRVSQIHTSVVESLRARLFTPRTPASKPRGNSAAKARKLM